MRNRPLKVALAVTAATLMPCFCFADTASDIHSLQSVLSDLYNQMMPMCSQMIDVGRGIAGLAALLFIATKVWRHLAAAEPIDFYPLLRPFAIGMVIMVFPAFLALINGVLQPTVTATAAMVQGSNGAIEVMLKSESQPTKDASVPSGNSDPDKWYQYTHPDNSSATGANTNPIADQFSGWGIKTMIKRALYEFLNICFEAAALCIDTIRTFKLIVLAILGPLCFGLGVFDGFQHTIKQWIARYINVFMWLPVANIFGAIISTIQQNMMHIQQAGGDNSQIVSDTNSAYLIFMLIGIVGYFTVPSIAGYIINVGGHALLSKTTALAGMAMGAVANGGMRSGGSADGGSKGLGQYFKEGYEGRDGGSGIAGAVGRALGRTGFMADRLSGRNDK